MHQPTPGYTFCDHCLEMTGWPQWRRVEPGEYTALCMRCVVQLEQTFTEDQAICQAIIIIGIRQGINRTAVKR